MMAPVVSYDALWRTAWGDLQRYGPVHRHALELVIRTVAALDVESIVDVGCGSGETLAALASLGRYVLTGIDVSAEALAQAKRRVLSAQFRQFDIEREVASERYDLVMSVQVVEHLLDDVAAFTHMARMARRYVLIATMQGRMRPSEVAIGHIRNYSSLELRRKLEAAELSVVRMWGWGFPFYSPLIRSLTEYLPGGPPTGHFSPSAKVAARLLYHLYRFNWPGRGDVLFAIARPVR